MNYKLDANQKSLGRLASEAAAILRGKNSPSFAPNRAPEIKLTVDNIGKIRITGSKKKQKTYVRHSGYPGSLKTVNLEDLIAKKGIEHVFKETVKGMLPKNKLKKQMMKNLIIK